MSFRGRGALCIDMGHGEQLRPFQHGILIFDGRVSSTVVGSSTLVALFLSQRFCVVRCCSCSTLNSNLKPLLNLYIELGAPGPARARGS